MCEVCSGKVYLIAERDDGRRAVERCDACAGNLSDEQAAILARYDGIPAAEEHPHVVPESFKQVETEEMLTDPLKPSTWKVVGQDDDGRDVLLCPATGERMIEDDEGTLISEKDLRSFEVHVEKYVLRVATISLRARDAEHARRLALLAEPHVPYDDGDVTCEVEITGVKEVTP